MDLPCQPQSALGSTYAQAVPASWFWPAAILDPKTGKLEVIPPGLAYDMASAGWDARGRVVTTALGLESSLWRFRPEKAPAK